MDAQCCFCGQAVGAGSKDLVLLRRPLSDGGEQELFSHTRCLEAVVDPAVPLAVENRAGTESEADASATMWHIPVHQAAAILLSSACEDDIGLYECIWELNGRFPAAPLGEKYRAATSALLRLAEKEWVGFSVVRQRINEQAEAAPLDEPLAAILANPVSWYPEHGGATVIVGATAAGVRAYNSGDAA